MRALLAMSEALERQRGRFFLWSPVCFGIGIGLYFGLRWEPGVAHYAALSFVAACLLGYATWHRELSGVIASGIAIVALGLLVAGARANLVAAEALGFRYYGPIEGRIVAIDRSISDAVRLTLDRVRLSKIAPGRTPERVRVSLHGEQGFFVPEPGLTVILTGHLSPPGGPVEPGGFDFRRQAWFAQLGAVGYTRTPVLVLAPNEGGSPGVALYRLRMRISAGVRAAMPGNAGDFAAAILVGDRSGIDAKTQEALRRANLAHLLAISGLHMGLLTGVIFGALRIAFALIPALALRYPVRKWAAAAAIVSGAVYLALSGANVATERAFIMVAVMFGAVLVNRRAITLRSVALAALIVLALRPEALLGPGFQMSFAATTALVVVYGAVRGLSGRLHAWPKWVRIVPGIAFSSLIAGAATAPIAAAHFNQIPHYGLIANVLSLPIMSAVVMPGAVLAAVLAPFGLGWIGLSIMAPGIMWILEVAGRIADWPGAVSQVVTPVTGVLPLLTLGALLAILWQGRFRVIGGLAACASLLLWHGSERPDVLISESGALVGVLTGDGRALSKAVGEGFAADTWLENDGAEANRVAAASRGDQLWSDKIFQMPFNGFTLIHATGKRKGREALDRCGTGMVLVTNVAAADLGPAPTGCTVYDSSALRETGSVAVTLREGAVPRFETAFERTGNRLWTRSQ